MSAQPHQPVHPPTRSAAPPIEHPIAPARPQRLPNPLPPPPPQPRRVTGDVSDAGEDALRRVLLQAGTVNATPWPDPLLERFGHDPRSSYAERFWLAVLGPSALWLLRLLAAGFDDHPEGYPFDLLETASAIGIGNRRGANSPFANTMKRLAQFGFIRAVDDHTVIVRSHMPTLTRRQLLRVPPRLREEHSQWIDVPPEAPPGVDMRRRARTLALSLLQLGEDLDATERQLHRWKFHPAMAFDAVRWAADQHKLRLAPNLGEDTDTVDLRALDIDIPIDMGALDTVTDARENRSTDAVAGDAA